MNSKLQKTSQANVVTRLLLIIQFVMGLTITASARDNLADMQFAAVKLSIYDQICAPLSAKYRETVEVVISTVDAPITSGLPL